MRPDIFAQLERVGVHDLILQGRVQVIGLEPLRNRFGDRWPKKCEHIWSHFEAVLLRPLPPDDLVVRVDDRHFVIAQTQQRGPANRRAGSTGSLMPDAGKPFTEKSLRRLAALAAARRVIPAVLLHGAPEDLSVEAIRVGASHCTLNPLSDGAVHV